MRLCMCLQMEVQAPPGTTIGYVKQDWHPFLPRFSIQGAHKETVMKLEGPCFACNCCGDVNFEVRPEEPLWVNLNLLGKFHDNELEGVVPRFGKILTCFVG